MTTWPGTSIPKSTGNAYPPAGVLACARQSKPASAPSAVQKIQSPPSTTAASVVPAGIRSS